MDDKKELKELGEEYCTAVKNRIGDKYKDIQGRLEHLLTLIQQNKDSRTVTNELDLIEKALKDKGESFPRITVCAKKLRAFWDVKKERKAGTTDKEKDKTKKTDQRSTNVQSKVNDQVSRNTQSDIGVGDNIINFFEQLLMTLHNRLNHSTVSASTVELPPVPAVPDKELRKRLENMHVKAEETATMCTAKNRDIELASELFEDLRRLSSATHIDHRKSEAHSNDQSVMGANRGVVGTTNDSATIPSRSDRCQKLQQDFEVVKTALIQMKDTQQLKPAVKEEGKNPQKFQSADRKKLEEEVESLRMRLSELAGAKLYKDNPDIADLSDPNRPTKLKENYCEIYSNEWMDAYQKLSENKSKMSEVNVIKFLLDILLEGFTYCKSIKELQKEGLQEIIFYPTKYFEKFQVKSENVEMNDIFARHLAEVLKLSGDVTGEHVAKAFFWKKEMRDKFGSDFETSEKYIKKCVKLCWLMQVPTPPVCIDLSAKPGDKFDKETYREYTKKGKKIDFIVWPPLRRNEGGPLIEKGVAQGK